MRPSILVGAGGLLGAALYAIGCVAVGVVEERPEVTAIIDGGPALFEAGESGSCAARCAGDLRSIDDCHGNVIQACGVDEGCREAACVPACDAAAAAGGTLGCEFFVAPVAVQNFFNGGSGTCVAAMVANGGRAPVSVTIEHRGAKIDVADRGRIPVTRAGTLEYAPLPADGKVPAEGIAVFFLHQTEEGVCPAPALATGPMLTGTGFGEAFRIQTSHPVSAYSVLPALTANASLALLYPAASWGTSHVATISEIPNSERTEVYLRSEETGIVLVAKNEASVTVQPAKDLVGNVDAGVRSVAAGASRQFKLGPGQTLQLSQREDLSGTVIVSDEPIGVFSASTWYPHISRHQQLAPVRATGHRYAAVRPRDREAPYPEKHGWRFVGMVDGTKLTYRPSAPLGAPTELAARQVVEIETGDRFVVESQDPEHPFALVEGTRRAQGTTFGSVMFESTPAVSLDQLVSAQLFYTVPGFSVGHLVVVREADEGGAFQPVELDCLGPLTGWQAIDREGRYQYALVDTPRFDYEKKTSSCDLGRRAMRSSAPFGVTVWGWLGNETYAYPAATGLRVVNDVSVSVQ